MKAAGLVLAALLMAAGCNAQPEPEPTPPPAPKILGQAEARKLVPVDGIEGTPIDWVDTKAAPGDPVDVVKYLTAIEVVSETYSDPTFDLETLTEFRDPPGTLGKVIDPQGYNAQRFGPTVGESRAFATELYVSSPSVGDNYDDTFNSPVDGEYVIVGQCIDRREQTMVDSPSREVPSRIQWLLLQEEKDTKGTDWTVTLVGAKRPPTPEAEPAFAAFEKRCNAFRSRPS